MFAGHNVPIPVYIGQASESRLGPTTFQTAFQSAEPARECEMVFVAQVLAREYEDGESVPRALDRLEIRIGNAGEVDIRHGRAKGGIARLDMHGGIPNGAPYLAMYHRAMAEKAWATLAARWLTAATASVSVGAQSDAPANGCDGLLGVRSTAGYLHTWSETIDLRETEEACRSSDHAPFYWQLRAMAENVLGNHRAALVDFDRQRPRWESGEYPDLPRGARSVPALAYIAERAASHRFVMVNERHHVSADRLLTLALLRPLYEQGFRYLAAEALTPRMTGIGVRGYPVRQDGSSYVDDPVFGELLREAVALGFQIVPYEQHEDQGPPMERMNDQQVRDYWQANNLITGTLERDPEAKVLVHCGYSHLHEVVSSRWTPMAHYFTEATGLDPLTVDQVLFAERGTRDAEHPWRADAESRGLVAGQPVVLVDAEGTLLPVAPHRVDVRVLGPRTVYVNDRPAWMQMDGRRRAVAISTPECVEAGCVVEASNVAWEEQGVPYDRIEVVEDAVDMYLPPGVEVELRAYRLDGNPVFQRTVSTAVTAKETLKP